MLKKISSILLMALLLSQVCLAQEIKIESNNALFRTGGVYEGEVELSPVADESYFEGFYSGVPFHEYVALYVTEYVAAYDELPEVIDGIASYGITESTLKDYYFDATVRHPELLLKTACSASLNQQGIIVEISPRFLVGSVSEMKIAQKEIEDGIKEYVDFASDYDTPLEKLLAIHDKMVENCVYDERVMSDDPSVVAQAPDSVYHAIGVFRDKFAVCQGYSQATYAICKELGIEADFCVSNDINHMWNFIKLGGKWYHYDMTNDDPVDEQGRAIHTFFMVSDGGLEPSAHGNSWRRYDGGELYTCNDTTYESDHLFNLSLYFKGYRGEDGFYHAYMGVSVPASEIDTVADIKSKDLYTGAVVVVPFVTEGIYTTTENGEQLQKKGTNLYMAEFTTRSIASAMPILKFRDTFTCMPVRASMADNSLYLRLLAVEAENLTVSDFTSFVLNSQNLTPYSTKKAWD